MRVIISTLLMCVAARAATLAPPLPAQCTDTFCPHVVCPDGTESITPRGECCPTMCTCPVSFNPCQNGGSCVSTTFSGDPTCACAPGYIGKTCESKPPPYACSNTTCFVACPVDTTPIIAPGQCCHTGCICPRDKNPCQNGGKCLADLRGDFKTCTCPPGYTGEFCELPLDSCADFVCALEECKDGQTTITLEGDCCPSCQAIGSCKYNGKIYLNGATFEATDGCNKCSCKDGMVGCTEMACPTGSCKYNGKTYLNGATFKANDGCNKCTCTDGMVVCTKMLCPDCDYNGQLYTEGKYFMDKCNECRCSATINPCELVKCAAPPCDESMWFTPDGACCPTCKATINPCELVKCAAPPCDESMWFTPDGACCPTCKGCIVSGRKYNEGQRVRCKDPKCTTCTCRGGVVEVEPKQPCPRLTCARPIKRRGQCCPECPKRRG